MAANERDEFWCRQKIEITVAGPERSQTVVVGKPFARVGSLERSEVCLDFPGMAARSLYLHATDEGVFCVPLEYTEDFTCHGWLQPDQTVRLGDHLMSARLAGGDARVGCGHLLLDARGSAEAPFPVFSVRHQGQEIRKCRLTRQLAVVGRRRPSHLRIKNQRMSAYHCVFYWCDGVLWVIDLLSTNRTFLDGHAVETSQLPLDGSVKIGRDLEIFFASVSERPSTYAPSNGVSSDAFTDLRLCRKDDTGAAKEHSERRLALPKPSPLACKTSVDRPQSNGQAPVGIRPVNEEGTGAASQMPVQAEGQRKTVSQSDAMHTDIRPLRNGGKLLGERDAGISASGPSAGLAESDDDTISPLVAFAQKKRGVFFPCLKRASILGLWALAAGAVAVFVYLVWVGKNMLGFQGIFQ